LFYVDGRSLKVNEPALWQNFQELRTTRNRLVHQGHHAELTRPRIIEFIRTVRRIIEWVDQKPAHEPNEIKVELIIGKAPNAHTPESVVAGSDVEIVHPEQADLEGQ
jgi:hypothetical protein